MLQNTRKIATLVQIMVNHTIKNLENSLIEIDISVEWEEFLSYQKDVIKRLGNKAQIDGFRKGKAPDSILIEKIGKEKIMFETAEEAIKKIYPTIIIEKNIDAIGRPEITITKLAQGNPFEFKAKQAVLPHIKLPDYKLIAKKINKEKKEPIIVLDKEIDQVLEEVKKNKERANTQKNKKKENIEINDEFAKSLGKFDSLYTLKKQIKENLEKEKIFKAKDKNRLKIIDAIIEKITLNIPEILIENEQEKMLHDLEARISASGLEFNAYLKHINKTKPDLKKAWYEQAKKHVFIDFLLNGIAKEESIKPEQKKVKKEIDEMLLRYPTANKENIRLYVESLSTYDKVYELLESQK